MALDSGTSDTATAGATFGSVSVEGSTTLAGSAAANSFTLEGGTVKATIAAGEMQLNYGTISGPGVLTLNSGGTGILAHDSTLGFVSGGKLINQGAMRVTGYGQVSMQASSQLENAGVLTMQDGSNIVYNDTTASKVVNDAGATLGYTASVASNSAAIGVPFTNNGTVTVKRGSLMLEGNNTFSRPRPRRAVPGRWCSMGERRRLAPALR